MQATQKLRSIKGVINLSASLSVSQPVKNTPIIIDETTIIVSRDAIQKIGNKRSSFIGD